MTTYVQTFQVTVTTPEGDTTTSGDYATAKAAVDAARAAGHAFRVNLGMSCATPEGGVWSCVRQVASEPARTPSI